MSLNTFHTSCPEDKRTKEMFVEFVSIGGESQRVAFEREVVWIRESETQLTFRHGGKVVAERGTYNDFYGYLSSMRACTGEPDERGESELAAMASAYSVSQDSSMTVEGKTTVSLVPALETPSDVEFNLQREKRKRSYTHLPQSWRQERVEDGAVVYPNLEPQVLVEEVIWTTADSVAVNLARCAAFLAKWGAPVPAAVAV